MAKLRDGTIVQGDETVTGKLNVTGAISGATVNTGHGANELHPMNQGVRTTDSPTFASINTGHGANELHPMNQGVRTTDNVTFNNLTVNGDETVTGNLVVKGNFTALYGINNLASTSWENISEIIDPEDWFNVGDEKTINIGGTDYIAQIYGFYHDDKVVGGKAKITFGLKEVYPPIKTHKSTNTNVGGWNDSLIRTYLNSTVYNALPSDLRSVIKQVNKPTANGGNQAGTTVVNSADKLFLFSVVEVFGTNTTYSHDGEGSGYPIFTDDSSRVRSNTTWWLRSPYYDSDYIFCIVQSYGARGSSKPTIARGVSFGFCV